jgi:hypothetical protein
VYQHVTAAQVALPDGFVLLTPPETVVASVEITRAAAAEEVPVETPAVAVEPPAE